LTSEEQKKDVDLVAKQAKELGLNTAFLEGVQATVARAVEIHSSEEADFASIYDAINPPRNS